MTHAMNRKVLSDFIAAIPKTSGWWYRLPQLNLKATKSNELYTETNPGCLYRAFLFIIFGDKSLSVLRCFVKKCVCTFYDDDFSMYRLKPM